MPMSSISELCLVAPVVESLNLRLETHGDSDHRSLSTLGGGCGLWSCVASRPHRQEKSARQEVYVLCRRKTHFLLLILPSFFIGIIVVPGGGAAQWGRWGV